jgi:hypothetical protein
MNESIISVNRDLKSLKRGQVIRIGIVLIGLAILTIILQITLPEFMDSLFITPLLIIGFWMGGMITLFVGFIVFMSRSKKARAIVIEQLYRPLFKELALRSGSTLTLGGSTVTVDPPWFISRPQPAQVVFEIGEPGETPLLRAIEIVYSRSTGTRRQSYIEFSGLILSKSTNISPFSFYPEQNILGMVQNVKSLSSLPLPLQSLLRQYGEPYPVVYAEVISKQIDVALSQFPLVRVERRYTDKDVKTIQSTLQRILTLVRQFNELF